jgi:hypothetical protein
MKRIALILLAACCACQSYVPLDLAPSVAGGDVRLSLAPGSDAVAFPHIGARVRQAEGRLLSANDSTLVVGVRNVVRTNGLEDAWAGDTVVFRRSEIQSVDRKELSTSRTFLSVGAFVVGGFLAHAGLKGGGSTGSGNPTQGGGN